MGACCRLSAKIAAVLIALVYVIAIIIQEHGISLGLAASCVLLLIPLALIWFPDELGSYVGPVGRGETIDTETPPTLLSFMGGFFSLGIRS